jgi:cell division transport system permease protein
MTHPFSVWILYFCRSSMNDDKRLVRRTQRSSRLSTIISISLVLFLLGTLGVLLLHAGRVSNYVKENIEINLEIKPDADSAAVMDLQKRILAASYVKSARYVSREEAADSLKNELGEDFVNFLGFNPLNASIDIRLKAEYTDTAVIEQFIASLRSNSVVRGVQYQASLVESINRNIRTLTWIILSFSLLLLLVSIALINNTIRISLYARRLLIKSMLLVGATRGFIRKPFLMNSIWNGIIGGLVGVVFLAVLIYLASRKIPELALIRDPKLLATVACGIVVGGALLSFLCTYFAVNKYLRYRTEDLY